MAEDIKFTKAGQRQTIQAAGPRARGTKDLPTLPLAAGDTVRVFGVGATAPPTYPPPVVPPTAELPAPTSLRFETENGEIYVAFNPVTGAETHHVEVRNAQGTFVEIDTLAAIVSGPLALATGNVVRVWAVNSLGVRIGAVASITYTAPPPPLPGELPAPTNLRFWVEAGETEFLFNPVPGASTHHVEILNASGVRTALDTSATSGSGRLTLQNGYSVRVWAVNGSGVRIGAVGTLAYTAGTPIPNPVPVPVPGPLPQPGGGGAGAVFEERWAMSTVAAGQGSIAGANGNNSIVGGRLRTAHNGSGGGGWNTAISSAGVTLNPPTFATLRPREIWLDTELLLLGDGWQRTSDYKTLFVMQDWRGVPYGPGTSANAQESHGCDECWRWDIYLRGDNGPFYGGYGFGLLSFDSSPRGVLNGQRTRLRTHFKMASNETASDGAYEVWLGDERVVSKVGIVTESASQAFFRVIRLGADVDPGAGAAAEWSAVRIHTSNPGW